jgi:carbamoyltransferase
MRIAGISAYYHDSAAAIVEDGRIVAAAQEERFSRRKHDPRFPHSALDFCLKAAGISLSELDHLAFYDKPFLKFERLLETYLAWLPRGFRSFRLAMPVWLREKLFLKNLLLRELKQHASEGFPPEKLLFTEHHLSHAASAFFPSPFEEAAVLTMDGVGEWATTSLAWGRGSKLEILRELHFPHSLGLLYSAFTYYLGFKVNSGEYKVMGLAPYGNPKYTTQIFEQLLDLKPDGTFRLNMDYFDYCTGLTMTNQRFDRLWGAPPRRPEELLEQRHMDLAASIQAVVEEVMLRLARGIALETGAHNLCLAGGVALNCVANGKIWQDRCFKGLWIQPASGDAGGALGAALAGYYLFGKNSRQPEPLDAMQGGFLGPAYSQSEIQKRLQTAGAKFVVMEEEVLIERCARELSEGLAFGWFQGRMEFGPRALGARSILADPRSPRMQSLLNLKVKFRESFRPFAPAVLYEDLHQWFELQTPSPYMLLVAPVKQERQRPMSPEEQQLFGIDKLNVVRSEIPAVTHVDYSARIQTVHPETNPRFHALLRKFKEITGCPVLVNTSFNVRGEPIVGTPEEAFRCFMGTDLDVLVAGSCYLRKSDQPEALKESYHQKFELD